MHPVVARITGVASKLDVAETAAQTVLSPPSSTPVLDLQARTGLALLAVQRSDAAGAQDQYGYLEKTQNTMVQGVISADRVLGLLSQTMGNLDQAAAHFEAASAFCHETGYRPELAWTCYDFAEAASK